MKARDGQDWGRKDKKSLDLWSKICKISSSLWQSLGVWNHPYLKIFKCIISAFWNFPEFCFHLRPFFVVLLRCYKRPSFCSWLSPTHCLLAMRWRQPRVEVRCGCAMSDGTWQTSWTHYTLLWHHRHSLSLSTRATSKGGEGGRVKAQMYLRHILGSKCCFGLPLLPYVGIFDDICLTRRVSRLSAWTHHVCLARFNYCI